MKRALSTRDTSRGARIATLECGLAQLMSQLTALQTRVGTLEVGNRAQQKAVARQLETATGPVGPVAAADGDADGERRLPSVRERVALEATPDNAVKANLL